ncbi:MAG: septum formation inhibitor Maf [Gammaproteobacteria bacterium]|nr:septum formation inhibitor Maf [Gammaproteobacteria bacterium]
MKSPLIILASASPRRVELLQQIQVDFKQQVADIDETHQPGESAQQFVSRLSLEKAQAIQLKNPEGLPVLGSDTIVVIDEHILGKPEDNQHALEMLSILSGRTHQVMTAVTLMAPDQTKTSLNVSDVTFMTLSKELMHAYVQTGESIGKAGAYAIQGIAGQFITEIRGSYSSIMGLPLYETRKLLEESGVSVLGSS